MGLILRPRRFAPKFVRLYTDYRTERRLQEATSGRPEVASHVQAQRRQPDRAPGVLHRAPPGSVPKRTTRSIHRGAFSRWRVASGVMFVLFGAIMLLFFTSDVFYVRSIRVRGNDHITREEVFAFSDIADYHMFWLDPEQIRENVLRSSSIADMAVELGWPPNLITFIVQERQPAIVWSDAGAETWIDIQGRVMQARAEMPNLLHVNLISDDYDGPKPSAEDFTGEMVLGALRLKEILPEGEQLGFHPIHGLGWTNELGWQVWMGSDAAAAMSEKVKMYHELVENIISRAIPIAELNIANRDAPFYSVIWGQ